MGTISIIDKEGEQTAEVNERVDGKNALLVESIEAGQLPWQTILFDETSNNPTYLGLHQDLNADVDSTNWNIYKFEYSGSDTTKILKATGAWSNRGNLF